jgi:hypothetical protein
MQVTKSENQFYMRKIKITSDLRDMILELKSSTKLASLLGDSNRFNNVIKKRTPIHIDDLIEIKENLEISVWNQKKVITKINELIDHGQQRSN